MLFLIRHADALDGDVDEERPLSPKGLRQVRNLARFLKESKAVDVREVWHSPLVRARETAEGLADELGWRSKLRESKGLRPEDPPGILAQRLRGAELPLALVGHNPSMEAIASLLVTGGAQPTAFIFRKSAMLALEPLRGTGVGQWAAAWQVAPELLG
jgi:phosphohistidine phosphatase